VSDVVVDGVLVCDKPAGMTSHDVVAKVRRLARQRRVGHGGTLDPPATGVLVIALGRATRLLPFLPMEPKRYVAEIAFGAETDTLDAAGTVTATAPADGVDEPALRRVLEGFLGPQQQIPPMISALKQGGERLYAKARRGETVEREPRPITIHALELRGFQPGPRPRATVAVTCSGGTYVRVLAADIGRALGTVAHLANLRRTEVGAFGEREAHTLRELEALPSLDSLLIDPAAAMRSVSVRALSEREAAALSTGQSLGPSGVGDPVAAVGPDGRLVGVIQDGDGRARPKVVLG
jgi:tRNA pseudouridine55 synthase